MRETSLYQLTYWRCCRPIEIPDGVTTCPKCGAELALEWQQPAAPQEPQPTISDREELK